MTVTLVSFTVIFAILTMFLYWKIDENSEIGLTASILVYLTHKYLHGFGIILRANLIFLHKIGCGSAIKSKLYCARLALSLHKIYLLKCTTI